MASIFEVNADGLIEYVPSDEESVAPDSGETYEIEESEVFENGDDVAEISAEGIFEPDTVEDEEIFSQTQEIVVANDPDNAVPVVLSDEVSEALIEALTPAGGSLGSTTLDYFDRLTGSFPSDYVYVAYRMSSSNSYDGVMYFGDNYDFDGTTISFGKNAVQVCVQRVTSYGSTTTEYTQTDAEGVDVTLSKDGQVVYYTNAEVGYPVLGGYSQPLGISPFLVVGLLSAMASVILAKLLIRK